MKEAKNTAKYLVDSIVEGIQDKKGTKIAVLDLTKLDNTICQYFVICEGGSTTQVDAIADSVVDYLMEAHHEKPAFKEGYANAQWILLDYFDVVVHVFQKEERGFYNLEALWADAEITEIPDLF